MSRLGIVILAVEDVARSARFYRDAFGWPKKVDVPVYVELQLPDGLRLGLYQRDGFGRNAGRVPVAAPPGELMPAELYFYDDDPAGRLERLRAAGGKLLSPLGLRDWGDEAAYCADPDGYVVVVARAASA